MDNEVATFDPFANLGIIRFEDGMKIAPGNLYHGLPDTLYHRGPGISKSGLDLINQSPGHYQFNKQNPPPETRALHIGKAFHCLLLEPERFKAQYVKSKFFEFRTKEAKEWLALQQAEGKFVIRTNPGENTVWNPSEWDMIHRMRDAIMTHPTASVFFSDGIFELSGYWIDKEGSNDPIWTAHGNVDIGDDPTYRLCKLRMDWYNYAHNIIVDLKTSRDSGYTDFSRHCVEYRYHVQDAWYRHGMASLNRKVDELVFVVIDKDPPYAVACYVLDSKAKGLGKTMYRRNLDTYHACMASGEWPLYEPMRELELQSYAYHNIKIF